MRKLVAELAKQAIAKKLEPLVLAVQIVYIRIVITRSMMFFSGFPQHPPAKP